MRLLHKAERTFITKVVDDTQSIVQEKVTIAEKIEALRKRVYRERTRIRSLRKRKDESNTDDTKEFKLSRIIELREKSVGYMQSTVDFLLHKDRYPNTLRQAPPAFALPDWETRPEPPEKPVAAEEYPFMEYSS